MVTFVAELRLFSVEESHADQLLLSSEGTDTGGPVSPFTGRSPFLEPLELRAGAALMPDIAVWDFVAPYFLLGEELTDVHAALAVLRVEEWESAEDLSGVVVRGRARFHGSARPWVDLQRMTFGVTAGNTEGGPRDDPAQRDPWLDLRDTTVDFHLDAPRVQAGTVQAALAAIPPTAPLASALAALDGDLADPPPSDYPSSQFVLDLVLTSAVLRPPGLYPAKLRADGLLEPDSSHTSVAITLPRIKLRLAQSSTIDPQPTLTLLSVGASGLDDPGDLRVAQLATMDPPYAFIGSGRSLGFGFRSAVLDLSDGNTPPDVLAQFGFDESWTGYTSPRSGSSSLRRALRGSPSTSACATCWSASGPTPASPETSRPMSLTREAATSRWVRASTHRTVPQLGSPTSEKVGPR